MQKKRCLLTVVADLQNCAAVDDWSTIADNIVIKLHNDATSNHLGWAGFFWLIRGTHLAFSRCCCVALRPLLLLRLTIL
jgi:hypothetical protein